MKNTKYIALILITALLASCADSVTPDEAVSRDPVGFLHGLWHGLILPFAWIFSLFDSDAAIYATYNNGGWYDFGFVLGVCGLGGSASSSKK